MGMGEIRRYLTENALRTSFIRGVSISVSQMSGERKTVIVGKSKPLLNYVTACITMFNSGAELVVLRARGEAINMAVDVAQVLKKRFVSNVQISNIVIDGENVTSRDGRQLNLPVLEIELSIPK